MVGNDCSFPKIEENNLYAIFSAGVSEGVPVSSPTRVAERIFECKPISYNSGIKSSPANVNRVIPPRLIRFPERSGFLIVNCERRIYVTVNTGRTVDNVVFYFHKEEPASSSPGADPEITWNRNLELKALDVAPAVTISPDGNTVLVTFNNYYAHGVINYNRELRLIEGGTFRRGQVGTSSASDDDPIVDNLNKDEVIAIPWFQNSGELAVALHILNIIGKTPEYEKFYKDRHAIRLV
jgi:hypothetical protein